MLVNISESEKDVSIMVGHFSIYVFESVCLFAANAKTTNGLTPNAQELRRTAWRVSSRDCNSPF